MGKLNIAHHKSYHPYRLDNIERVKRDEEEAKRKEEGQEDRMRVADAEARLGLLRARADSNLVSNTSQSADVEFQERNSGHSGHINLFADLEQQELAATIERSRHFKQSTKADEEKGVRLGPSAKDLKPWYVDEKLSKEEPSEDKKMKDLTSKMLSDPLTSIKHELSRSYPSSQKASVSSFNNTSHAGHSSEDRVRRESKERARAMELIRKKQKEKERELLGNICMTPSTVYSDNTSGYRDVYNPRETEEAHRRWERKAAPVERRRDKRK